MEPGPSNAVTDADLVRTTLAGDLAAFAAVVERHHRPLQGFLFRLVLNRHDAEDLVQETFVAAYRHLGRYDARYGFKTWLFTIGRRLAISALRRRRLTHPPGQPLPEPADAADAGDAGVRRREASHDLHAALAELSPAYRQALWLFHVEEMAVADVAAVLGKTGLGTRVLLHRARTALRRQLAGRLADEGTLELAAVPVRADVIMGGK
jgi:RNA polymerase sigma-70 factor, ECF subfamily